MAKQKKEKEQDAPPGSENTGGNQDNQQQMVSISKEDLEALKGLIPTVQKLQEDNEMLKAVADKNKVFAFQERTKTPGGQFVRISTFEHEGVKKLVTAWKLVKDIVYKGANGAWVEDQQVEMLFDDNTKHTVSLADFYRKTADKLKAEVKKRELLENGSYLFTVTTEDGRELVVNGTFVN